jgi:hypothetical protein
MQRKSLSPAAFSMKSSLLAVCLLGMTLSLGCVSHRTMGPTLSAGNPGVSLLDQTTLISALPIKNIGGYEAKSVRVEAITLKGAALTAPSKLPFHLGTISAGSSTILDAGFVGKEPFTPGSSFVVTVKGTNVDGTTTKNFVVNYDLRIPPRAPGSSYLTEAKVEPNKSTGGPFPPYKPQRPGFVPANPAGPPVPTAPFVPSPGISSSTELLKASLDGSEGEGVKALKQAARAIVFNAINGLGLTGANTIAEPSGASNGDGVIFATANSVAAFSMDGGSTFTQVNPTTVFPADTVGFCCDQIVQYVPSIDRFIWLLQGSTTATQAGGYRLASARPADIISNVFTAWTYWNLTPAVFGQPAGTGFDYPDMAVGNNFLYLSWDAGFGCPAGCSSGFQVSRIPLAAIQAGGTIGIGFTNPTDAPKAWGSHISQNTFDEIFWAGHENNSKMRVFSLAEGSNSYFWRDVGISSWANNAPTSTTPDGQDWLGKNFSGATGGGAFPRNAVIGATRSGNQIWFAWTAGTNGSFKQAHVEMVILNRNDNFSVAQQVQIWNNDYAFAYPALATLACNGEVGLSLEYGGNGNYENHVVGFWGDFVLYITTGSDVGTNRFGDYVTIRQEPATRSIPGGNLFNAYGYGLNSIPAPGAGTQVDVRHVLYGRPLSECNIID